MTQRHSSHYLELAAKWDAAGNHDEAINELARGTRAGDVECTAWLGLRLLTGDRSPLLPGEGLRFLSEAWEKGSGFAAARGAAIMALGVQVPQNWKLALEWLAMAAQKDHAPAQRQLLALGADRELAARLSASKSPPNRTQWQQLAASVDVNLWRRSPPANILSDEPRVSTFPGFTTPEVCEVLVSLATGRLEPARVYDPVGKQDIVDAHRNNTVANFGFEAVEVIHALVQERMAAACGMPLRHFEPPTELHYSPGEQITNHYDFVDPKSTDDYAGEIARNGQRLITFILYLNDDYDGGETAFPTLGFSHKGRTGEGIYFVNALPDMQPDLRMLHAGRPTTRGEKWIVTQFIRNRPTR
jgi:prolyl 4-hydroxylase